MNDVEQRQAIVTSARAFFRLGYLHGFGHISHRVADGILITPTRPGFLMQQPADLLLINDNGEVISGDRQSRPIECWLHIAIYRSRNDVNAICRTHSPYASAICTADSIPGVRHGFGGIARNIGFHGDVDLVHSIEKGEHAAHALGKADALILRGNGTLSVGSTMPRAAANVWSVEERLDPVRNSNGLEFSDAECQNRARWYEPEIARIWAWLKDKASAT